MDPQQWDWCHPPIPKTAIVQSSSQQCPVDKVGKLAGLAVAVGDVLLLQQGLQLGPQLLRLVLHNNSSNTCRQGDSNQRQAAE